MPIVISHNSALEYLRSIPPSRRIDEPTTSGLALPARFDREEIRALDVRSLGLRSPMTHVLNSSSAPEARAKGFKSHHCSIDEIPPSLLLQVSPDIYVCGPELVFIQMASQLSPLGSIVLGYELCGSYSHFAPLVSGFYDREPLTSTDRIISAIDLLKGTRGCGVAQTAIRHVLDKSASPMETVTANLMFLPGSMGGLSLIKPELNYEVLLDSAAARIAGTEKCIVDCGWKDLRRAVEYAGKAFHTDPVGDRNRIEALMHMDYAVYTIDLDRLVKFSEFKKVTDLLRQDIPKQPRTTAANDSELWQLHGRLLRATRFGLGMNAVLFGVPVEKGEVAVHL